MSGTGGQNSGRDNGTDRQTEEGREDHAGRTEEGSRTCRWNSKMDSGPGRYSRTE